MSETAWFEVRRVSLRSTRRAVASQVPARMQERVPADPKVARTSHTDAFDAQVHHRSDLLRACPPRRSSFFPCFQAHLGGCDVADLRLPSRIALGVGLEDHHWSRHGDDRRQMVMAMDPQEDPGSHPWEDPIDTSDRDIDGRIDTFRGGRKGGSIPGEEGDPRTDRKG
eukprot:scaffold867_cov317-Pavlova_lutheri.AAC.20